MIRNASLAQLISNAAALLRLCHLTLIPLADDVRDRDGWYRDCGLGLKELRVHALLLCATQPQAAPAVDLTAPVCVDAVLVDTFFKWVKRHIVTCIGITLAVSLEPRSVAEQPSWSRDREGGLSECLTTCLRVACL